jgi:hypothetical protein
LLTDGSILEELLRHVTVDPLDPVIWFVPEGTVKGNFYMYFLSLVRCFFLLQIGPVFGSRTITAVYNGGPLH